MLKMNRSKNVKKRLGGAAKERERKKNKLNEAAKTCQNLTFFINNKALKNQTRHDFDNNILTSHTVSLYFWQQLHLELFILVYIFITFYLYLFIFIFIFFKFIIHNCTYLLIINNRNMNMTKLMMWL